MNFFFGIGYEECGVFNVGRIFFLGVEITVLEFFLESVGRGLRKGVLTFRERQRDHHTTDTRDRQHDDDFEKGLDCGDHLSVLDPPFDGAAGCLRDWRVERRVGRRLIFEPLDHQWVRLLPYCRERWLCEGVI